MISARVGDFTMKAIPGIPATRVIRNRSQDVGIVSFYVFNQRGNLGRARSQGRICRDQLILRIFIGCAISRRILDLTLEDITRLI